MLFGQLVSDCFSPSSASGATPPGLSRPWDCHQLGEVRLKQSSRAWYLKMLIDTIRKRVFPTDSQIVRFQDLVNRFLLLPSSPAKIWQQLLCHMASPDWFAPWDRARMCPLQWQLKAHWFPASDNPAFPCFRNAEERWTSGLTLQVSLPSLLYIDASLTG